MVQSLCFYGGTLLFNIQEQLATILFIPSGNFYMAEKRLFTSLCMLYPIIPYSSLTFFSFFFFPKWAPTHLLEFVASQPRVSPSWGCHLLSKLHSHFVNKSGGGARIPFKDAEPTPRPPPHSSPVIPQTLKFSKVCFPLQVCQYHQEP